MIRLPSFWPSKNGKSPPPQEAPPPPRVEVPRLVVPALPVDEQRYLDAFTSGYALAVSRGIPRIEQLLLDRAATQVLGGLNETIANRAKEAGMSHPRPVVELQSKRREFEGKLQQARSEMEKQKYTHYLEALGWMLGDDGH